MPNSAWISVSREAASLVVSLALLVVGIAFLGNAIRLDFGSVAMPGPGMFPTLAAGLLSVLAAIMAARNARALSSRSGAEIEIGHRNSALAAGLLLLMSAVFEPLGATLSAFVLVAILAVTFTGRRWWAAVLFAAGLSVAVVFVFERLLEVSLPHGILRLF